MRKIKYTLIELLVVISVLSLLVSILIPSLNKAREMGFEAVCLSNRKQNASGLFLFTSDNKGKFPIADINLSYKSSYFIKIDGYYHLMGKTIVYNGDEVLTCPKMKSSSYWSGDPENVQTQRRWLSYNGGIFVGFSQENAPSMSSTDEKAIYGDLLLRSDFLGFEHKRRVKNIAFIDGSVKTIKDKQLVVLKTLPNWPSDLQYQILWESLNELYGK